MSPIDQPVIPKGATVLITSANGFIGSNIADQFLKLGYNVRGTTRNLEKNAWVSKLFESKYGPGKFEMVLVPEMKAEGAYDEAVKGMYHVLQQIRVVSKHAEFRIRADPEQVYQQFATRLQT